MSEQTKQTNEQAETFGDLMRAARLAAGLTQPELGRRIGVSRQRVGAWEGGVNTPTYPTLLMLCEALGLPLAEAVAAQLRAAANCQQDGATGV